MSNTKANGQKFIATCDHGPVAMIGIANILRTKRPTLSQNVPRKELPNLLVRVVALFRPALRGIVAIETMAKRSLCSDGYLDRWKIAFWKQLIV
ncbi:hypothetical protein VI817_002428 [Penicillium citrinum]|nr:hypothetical protein VI817_002428 [Penicillium citrinum]